MVYVHVAFTSIPTTPHPHLKYSFEDVLLLTFKHVSIACWRSPRIFKRTLDIITYLAIPQIQFQLRHKYSSPVESTLLWGWFFFVVVIVIGLLIFRRHHRLIHNSNTNTTTGQNSCSSNPWGKAIFLGVKSTLACFVSITLRLKVFHLLIILPLTTNPPRTIHCG